MSLLRAFRAAIHAAVVASAAANLCAQPAVAGAELRLTADAATSAPAAATLWTTGGIFLPNQWTLRPAGTQLPLGDFPVTMALSPDGRYAAILHCGYGPHEIRVFNLATRDLAGSATLERAWLGCTFSPDGTHLYASAGTYDQLIRFNFKAGALYDPTTVTLRLDEPVPATTATAEERSPWYPGGIAITPDGRHAYVALTYDNRLLRIDLSDIASTPTVVAEFEGDYAYPYRVVLHPSRPVAYVSLWGGKAVAEVALPDGAVTLVPTDSHPNDLVITADGSRLFVACANTNLVDIIDTAARKVTERLDSALYPDMPPGSTPNSLALSADGETLLIANADNNNVCVFEVGDPGYAEARGYIPTGWYPTAVAFSPHGDILVVNAKGVGSLANPEGPNPMDPAGKKASKQYIGGLLPGSLSFIPMPDQNQLWAYTGDAYKCSPLRGDLQPVSPEPGNPIPVKVGDPSPIKYCVYIIKENRTYDQVFGDMPEGNGDASLCLFPERVTPNHHAIAREFVLLDNFYVESEVSADGHEWTTGAYATDFVEKTWPPDYGGKGNLSYPSEGLHPVGVPDSGHIWDRAREAGITYRSYGEWVEDGGPEGKGKARAPALEGHIDPYYRGWDMNYPDTERAKRFLEELSQFDSGGTMPQLMILRLPNDHAEGTRVGKKTPRAFLAENDLALGQILEGLSKSKFWKEMAVFVVEDDAQNGPDHVDAHRTVALVAGPYVKRGRVISQMYSTASMLRTMELILGLRPMSQFDAAARPMYACFTSAPDFKPYTCKPATYPLDELNPDGAPGQKESALLDMSKEDANADVAYNEILWKSVHGADSEMPAPVRAAFIHPVEGADGDD